MEEKRIKVLVLTGFLGAGKTTLLQNIIENGKGKKIGILVNEFGKLGIDGSLIQRNGISLMEINNGSIFCSCLEEAFIDGLIAFSKMPLDYLLIESSGLADPSSIGDILKKVEDKIGRVLDYRGMVCVVDAARIDRLLGSVRSVERQIEYSDVILLNKIDLVDEDKISQIKARIREIRPDAALFCTSFCRLEGDLLNSLMEKAAPKHEQSSNTPSTRPNSLLLRTTGIFEKEKLFGFLQSFAEDTYRMKGYFLTEKGWYYIDGIGADIAFKPAMSQREESELVVLFKKQQAVIKLGRTRISTESILGQKIKESWKQFFPEELVIQ